jgi:uncharacterized membrane protein
MELIVSSVLQIGVIVSSAVILLGIALFLTQSHQNSLNGSYHHFTSSTYSFPHNLSALNSSIRAGAATGFIELGVLLLILTPILRVATSILLFLRQRDISMTLVTLFVLLVLTGSFVIGVIIK